MYTHKAAEADCTDVKKLPCHYPFMFSFWRNPNPINIFSLETLKLRSILGCVQFVHINVGLLWHSSPVKPREEFSGRSGRHEVCLARTHIYNTDIHTRPKTQISCTPIPAPGPTQTQGQPQHQTLCWTLELIRIYKSFKGCVTWAEWKTDRKKERGGGGGAEGNLMSQEFSEHWIGGHWSLEDPPPPFFFFFPPILTSILSSSLHPLSIRMGTV